MRTHCASIEPGRNARALERVFQQTGIALRRPHEHRDLVERDARACLFEDAPCDFDAFAAFARSREEAHVARLLPSRRLPSSEQIPPECDQVGGLRQAGRRGGRGIEDLRVDADRREPLERLDVAERHGDQHVRRRTDQRLEEFEFDLGFERDVQQQQRYSGAGTTRSKDSRRRCEERRTIGRGRLA